MPEPKFSVSISTDWDGSKITFNDCLFYLTDEIRRDEEALKTVFWAGIRDELINQGILIKEN